MRQRLEGIFERRFKVGIFGVGKSNVGVIDFLRRRGYDFSLTVRSDKIPENYVGLRAQRCFFGERAYLDIDEDILFLSPSVRRDRGELICAAARGCLLFSDAELYFALSGNRTYAVSGSDGKSTTTYLIASMLRHSGVDALPCGNFGISLSSLIDTESVAVAELSSFQLNYCIPKSRRAVLTPICENHLDWHRGFQEYLKAKSNITTLTEGLVIDYDSEWVRHITRPSPIFCAVSAALPYEELCYAVRAENYMTLVGEDILLNGKRYVSLASARRRESYNVKNYMLASAALISDISPEAAEAAIADFRGLLHRAERVRTLRGITFINSSIDSTPERTLNTLRSLEGKVVPIIGGRGKGLSLAALAEALPTLTVGACLMGEVGEELSRLLTKTGVPYPKIKASSMDAAIRTAMALLGGTGTVILSPAATSFDRYKSFEERGEDFKRAVLSLD